MVDIYDDAYWTAEFAITAADLDRIAGFISEQDQAQDLTVLIKRVVRGRLRHGDELGTTAVKTADGDAASTVRLWDPAGDWETGDLAIVIRRSKPQIFSTFIGEVTDATLVKVAFHLPDKDEIVPFQRAEKDSENARNWHAKVLEVVSQKRAAEGEEESVELIILKNGERLSGMLLQALGQDERFVRLDGRYFLRSLAVSPSKSQLHQLAWSLLGATEALYTSDLIDHIPNFDLRDETLFGLYISMRQHPQWFTNTQPGKRPLWTLAGPPPSYFMPQYPAYDPDSYEILCMPEIEAPPEAVARLWETELLTAVV